MFAGVSMPIERPAGWRRSSLSHSIKSATNSPVGSRSSSISPIASAQTDPGLVSGRSRQSSSGSTESTTSSKSGLRSLFGSKREKKPKAGKDVDKVVLTSRHAAAVKTKMMMDSHSRKSQQVKTAGVVGTIYTGHMTAAEQEARHPHSGPPAVHTKKGDMPLLTRIVSGDEHDDEEEFVKLQRARLQWEAAKLSSFVRVREDYHDDDTSGLVEAPTDEHEILHSKKPQITFSDQVHRRSVPVARNVYGGRFHRNENGNWTR